MKLGKITQGMVGLGLLFAACGAWAHCGGNHGIDHPHCNGGGASGGDSDPTFSVESLARDIPSVNCWSLDPGDIVAYRDATVDPEDTLNRSSGNFAGCFQTA